MTKQITVSERPSGPLCAGINLGYGHIKLSTPGGAFIVASAFDRHNQLYDGLGRNRDTHKVKVGGLVYEIGADVIMLARAKETVRIPEPKWLGTLRYRVFSQLVFERLAAECNDWQVVLGLPISDYRDTEYRQLLESYWQGEHETENGTIRIRNARAVPEPIGALFAETASLSLDQKIMESRKNHLVIDPGYFTSDWLALYSLSPDLVQSGGIDIGMHAILKELMSLISRQYGDSGSDLVTLEKLLLEDIHQGCQQGDIDLRALAQQAADTVFAPVMGIIHSAIYLWESTPSVKKTIFLAGGTAPFIFELVKQTWPKIDVKLVQDFQMANAVGYRIMAQMMFSDGNSVS